jgi:hypothetical protein
MVFANEAPLTGLGIDEDANSDFAKTFASQGPRDSKGRSLRDFDLKTHTFCYSRSYLIYTEAFDSIPEPAKSYLYHRLLQVSTGEDQSADLAGISPESRRASLEFCSQRSGGCPRNGVATQRPTACISQLSPHARARSTAKQFTLYQPP